MKKLIKFLHWMACLLTLLTPVGSLLSILFGYRFYLANYELYAVLMTLVLAVHMVLSLIEKEAEVGKVGVIFVLLLPPMMIANWVLFIFQSVAWAVPISLLIGLGCACVLALRYCKKTLLAAVSIILTAVMLFPVLGFTFLELFIGGLSQKTVVETMYSPGCSYYAQVIDDDQGAMGGASHVYVYENSGIDLGVFRTEKLLKKIYYGRWMAYLDMSIHWESDNCLVIDGKEYLFE